MAQTSTGLDYDIEFFWDPVCPFAWISSRWVERVATLSRYQVDWRFVSLRLINKDKDYARDFPAGYEEGHTAGLRMLRVAAAVRADLGRDRMGVLVAAFGHSHWDRPQGSPTRGFLGTVEHASRVLEAAGLPLSYADAVDDASWDGIIDEESELALSRTGRDTGTPIITFRPPDGPSFFGPIISRVPGDEDALRLWDAVTTLAVFPGFAELKRSLREHPQLNLLGPPSTTPVLEEWKDGHLRGHLPSETSADR